MTKAKPVFYVVTYYEYRSSYCACCYDWEETEDVCNTIRDAIDWAKIKSFDNPYETKIYRGYPKSDETNLLAEYQDGKRERE